MRTFLVLILLTLPSALFAQTSQRHVQAAPLDPFETFDVGALESRSPFEARFPELFGESEEACVGSDFAEESMLEVYELSPTTRSVAILCMPGAYNMLYTMFTASLTDDGWQWERAVISTCGSESRAIVNPYFDEETAELGFFEKGTGAGGCGVAGSLVWTETGWGAGWCRSWDDCAEPLVDEWPVTFGEAPELHSHDNDDKLPPAFSPDELASGIEHGEHYVFQVDQPQGTSQTHMIYLEPNPNSVTVETWEVVDGTASGPVAAIATWAELSEHGAYTADRTEVRPTICETGVGDYPGRLFVIQEHDGSVVKACFADALPGPPVRYVMELEGQAVFGMQLVAHTIASEAP